MLLLFHQKCNTWIQEMLLNEIRMPIQQRSIERLEQVIETTLELLETKHIEECTIQEISTISKVPRNYIYQYFPTINHLFSVIVNRYFEKLQQSIKVQHDVYKNYSCIEIIQDMIQKTVEFYNQNKVARVLILGGPVNIDGFSLQQAVTEHVALDLFEILKNKNNPVIIQELNHITYMIQLATSLMKHSFYRHEIITPELQQEALFVCKIYLINKGYTITD